MSTETLAAASEGPPTLRSIIQMASTNRTIVRLVKIHRTSARFITANVHRLFSDGMHIQQGKRIHREGKSSPIPHKSHRIEPPPIYRDSSSVNMNVVTKKQQREDAPCLQRTYICYGMRKTSHTEKVLHNAIDCFDFAIVCDLF